MNTDIYVEKEPHQGNEYFSRIMRFRNNRVAKFFSDNHGGIYKGWVDESTTFTIKRSGIPVTVTDKGCYIVVWE